MTDVVVMGAGIIGAAVAHALAARGIDVVVLERAQSPATGSTGRSFASVRGQWPDEVNARISWGSIQRYRDAVEWIGEDVGYRPSGYLLLVPDGSWDAQLRAVEVQRRVGVPVEVLTTGEAQRLTPFLADGVAGCTWGPADGVVDPHLVTNALLGGARRRGAQLVTSTPVTAIAATSPGYRVFSGDHHWDAPILVNAAGGWAGEIAALAGLHVPVHHVRRTVFGSAEDPRLAGIPMTIDVGSGFYLRSEGSRLLFGQSDPDEPPGYRTDVAWDWLEPTLRSGCARFPWLADVPLDDRIAWAGTYDTSPDHRPFLGRMPDAPGWVNACGFSGHGVMQAPMVGHLIAEEIVDGRARTIDIEPLRIERLSGQTDEPLRLVF